MKNRNRLQLIIATIAVLMAGLTYADLLSTNYLAGTTAIIEDSSENSTGETTLNVGAFGGKIRRGLLKAADPDVPGGYAITNATLHIYQFNQYSGVAADMNLLPMLTEWDEADVNWTNKTATATWSAPGMVADVDYSSTIISSNNASGWTSFDITYEFNAFADNTETNNGWYFQRDSESGYTLFRTVHSQNDKTLWPYVRIAYKKLTEDASVITNSIAADSQINSNNPYVIGGGSTTMEMGYSASKGTQRGLIKFACTPTDFPINAEILSADIRIYQNHSEGLNNFVDIHRVLKDWDADQTSWTSNTVSTAWATPGLDAGTDYVAEPTDTSYMPLNEYVTFDVTEDVKAFRSGSANNYGWLMVNEVEDDVDKLAVFRTDNTLPSGPAVIIIRYHIIMGTVITIH